jgi:hypothetical protein
MFDRARPLDADAGSTIKGYPSPGNGKRAAEKGVPLDGHCQHCGARVQELRRGRCWGCYQAWAGLRPVGRGARCLVCYERRGDALRLVEIHGRWRPLRHGCATRASWLSPVPCTIEGLRRGLARERRAEDRRVGALDVRVFARERRGNDRRAQASRPCGASADELGEVVLELDLNDIDVIDIVEITTVQLTSDPPKKAASKA